MFGGVNSFIGGGTGHLISGDYQGFIGGGSDNDISSSTESSIVGGKGNVISNTSQSSILGGSSNNITGFNDAFVVGSNINAYANNAAFVENLYVIGNLSKATGTFRIDYPSEELAASTDLVHSFVESPTAGENIYRFSWFYDERNPVPILLPEWFPLLNNVRPSRTGVAMIQVWCNDVKGFGLAYGIYNVEKNVIDMYSNTDGATFNVLVIGTRNDPDAVAAWGGPVQPKSEAQRVNYERRNT
jgi:hypothetical protein